MQKIHIIHITQHEERLIESPKPTLERKEKSPSPSAQKKEAKSEPGTKKKPKEKEWTFLSYIAGDNNLSDYGLKDIQEMCSVGSSPTSHVGVQIDTFGEYDGIIRYEISKKDWMGNAHRKVIERLPEMDSGSPHTIEKFLSWGFQRYPSQKTLVVVWNHGSGFRDVIGSEARKNIAYDDFGDSLDMPELAGAVQKALKSVNKSKIDVLGFDACLMSMLEVAYQFKDTAHYIVGSQQTEPGDGWPYDGVLEELNQNPSSEQLAKKIVHRYAESYQGRQTNITQSAIRVDALQEVKQAVENLADAMMRNFSEIRDQIRAKRFATQCYAYADYVDLVHLAQELKKIDGLGEHAERVEQAVREAVIENFYHGRMVKNSNGLSIWFPPTEASYLEYKAQYMGLKFNGGEGNGSESTWTKFLDTYFVGPTHAHRQ